IDSSCCFSTAQESDSRSNVSLATQFFSSLLEQILLESADRHWSMIGLALRSAQAQNSPGKRYCVARVSKGGAASWFETPRTIVPEARPVCDRAAPHHEAGRPARASS